MTKLMIVLTLFVFGTMMVISVAGFAGQTSEDKLYNAREELEYGYHAMLDRQEEQNHKIQLQRYQQQEYMQKQQLMNQQSMYNMAHPANGGINTSGK